MSGLLARILASKAREVEALRADRADGVAEGAPRPRDVLAALRRPHGAPLRLIAEVKLRSPSAGPLSTALSPAERAVAYARAGAAMVSVLCDGPFFGGSYEDLAAARSALDEAGLPALLLAKEFVIDDAQIARARRAGADAVLLIVRVTSGAPLAELVVATRASGMEPLVEVVSEAELDDALAAGARLVGVNARDLDTLAMDRARATAVLARIPASCVPVHLSGLRVPEDVTEVARGPTHAALIGEALMRQDDPSPLLAAMVAAAGAPRT